MMRKKQEGFTLLEVIVATAISTIIVFGAFGILQVSNRQLQIIHTVMSLQEGPDPLLKGSFIKGKRVISNC